MNARFSNLLLSVGLIVNAGSANMTINPFVGVQEEAAEAARVRIFEFD
jgi:hypothetical protein